MANNYRTSDLQHEEHEMLGSGSGGHQRRDGILLGEEYLDGLFLNAHPQHCSCMECDYDHEVGEARHKGNK